MTVMLKGRLLENGTEVEVDVSSLIPEDSGGEEAPIEDIHLIGDTDEPVFENGWHNYNAGSFVSAGFYKDRDRVFLSGSIDGGVASNQAFTLPADYRPDHNVAIWGNDTDYVWLITPAGLVVPKLRNSPYGWSLNGVSFRVA